MLRQFQVGEQDRDAFRETWDRTLEPLVFGDLRGVNDVQRQPGHFERVRQVAAELVRNG